MPTDTRIAAVFFVVPFTVAVCIVAVETDLASSDSFTALLVLSQNLPQPEDPIDR